MERGRRDYLCNKRKISNDLGIAAYNVALNIDSQLSTGFSGIVDKLLVEDCKCISQIGIDIRCRQNRGETLLRCG